MYLYKNVQYDVNKKWNPKRETLNLKVWIIYLQQKKLFVGAKDYIEKTSKAEIKFQF